MITKITNAKIVLGNEIKTGESVYFEDGVITEITDKDLPCDEVIDAKGNYLSAGFIDIHTHGGGGFEFIDGTKEAFITPAVLHAKHGTTALYPTVSSGSFEEIVGSCEAYKNVMNESHNGARLMGLHLEGPYFAMSQRGAQDPRYVRNPDPKEYMQIIDKYKDILSRWSAAPELEGAYDFAKALSENGILAAMGHTEVDCIGAKEAIKYGFTHITHLYSCTTPVMRKNAFRYAGLNDAAFLYDDLTIEIIGDGCHLPKELLQFIYKLKPVDKIALITDSIRSAACDYPEGTIVKAPNGGSDTIIEDNVAKLPDRTAFAGSIATMDRVVRNMVKLAEAPIVDAVKMATKVPASIMKEEKMGEIKKGYFADFVIFDDDINVKYTIVAGKTVFEGENL